jgi:hypothetical protein
MSHVDTLKNAGVLDPDHCSEAHKDAINSLSDEEVATLIQVKRKVDKHLSEPSPLETAGRPWVL